jgi:hypothetical protein
MDTILPLREYVVFGINTELNECFTEGWEYIGKFMAEGSEHALEQAKNAEEDKTYFFVAFNGYFAWK